MGKSVYEQLVSNIVDGNLDKSFRFDKKNKLDKKLPLAQGALEGITLYHTKIERIDDTEIAKLKHIIALISSNKYYRANKEMISFCRRNKALKYIDELQKIIIEDRSINGNNMVKFAYLTIINSSYVDCVKFGLCILELYEVYRDETIASAIKNLGLSSEFTLFSLYNIRNWPNSNELIFELAKKQLIGVEYTL